MSVGKPDFECTDILNLLAQLATSIRQRLGEEGMVIWYDSVTIKVDIFTQILIVWWCLPSPRRDLKLSLG